jgi:hypothetical protein
MDDRPTQRVDLTQLVEVPAPDGGVTRKRLVDLSPADLEALARRHRIRQAEQQSGGTPGGAASP